jgi:hypothetical protein
VLYPWCTVCPVCLFAASLPSRSRYVFIHNAYILVRV